MPRNAQGRQLRRSHPRKGALAVELGAPAALAVGRSSVFGRSADVWMSTAGRIPKAEGNESHDPSAKGVERRERHPDAIEAGLSGRMARVPQSRAMSPTQR